MLKTVDEVCDFIAEWCGETGHFAGPPFRTKFAVPNCIARLNARFGDLWRSAKPERGPVLRYATPFLGMLAGQDEILDPRDCRQDQNGVVTFVRENQGVWSCGFDPQHVDQFLVSGDWKDRGRCNFENDWRRVAATPEDALVCTLLHNVCSQSEATWYGDPIRHVRAKLVLWEHPAWDEYFRFWINEAQTSLYWSSWEVTRRGDQKSFSC